MNDQNTVVRLSAVVNTLSATTIRADQLDAVQRINACTNELRAIISEIQAKANEHKEG